MQIIRFGIGCRFDSAAEFKPRDACVPCLGTEFGSVPPVFHRVLFHPASRIPAALHTNTLSLILIFFLFPAKPGLMSNPVENADWDFVLQFVSEPLDLEMPAPEKPVSGRIEPPVGAAVTQVPTPPVRDLRVRYC